MGQTVSAARENKNHSKQPDYVQHQPGVEYRKSLYINSVRSPRMKTPCGERDGRTYVRQAHFYPIG